MAIPGPRNPEPVARRSGGREHAGAPAAVGHHGRLGPALGRQRGHEEPPVIGQAAALAVADQQVQAVLVIDGQAAVMVELAIGRRVHFLAASDLEGRRRAEPPLAGVGHDFDAAQVVDRVAGRGAHRIQPALILRPVHAARLVAHPDPIAAVHRQIGPRLEPRRGGDFEDRPRPAGDDAAHAHVVASPVVGVPGHDRDSLGVDRDRRFPVIPGTVADQRFPAPGASGVGHVEDVGLPAPERLPDDADRAVPERHVMVEVRLRGAGQALQRAEGAPVVPAGVEVEIAVHLLRPDRPQPALPVEGKPRLPDIAAHAGDLRPRAPALLLVVVAGQADLVLVAIEAQPGHPDFGTVGGVRDDVREIVRAGVFRQAHRLDDAGIERRFRLWIPRHHERFRGTQMRNVLAGGFVLGGSVRP